MSKLVIDHQLVFPQRHRQMRLFRAGLDHIHFITLKKTNMAVNFLGKSNMIGTGLGTDNISFFYNADKNAAVSSEILVSLYVGFFFSGNGT
jgi:hypothetical protein